MDTHPSTPILAMRGILGWTDDDRLTTALAIAYAESGLRWDAINRADANAAQGWGPSVGLWQIRTRIDETGTGSARDIDALTPSHPNDADAIAAQVRAMGEVSSGGTNWEPWSVWWYEPGSRTGPAAGRYREYLDRARREVELYGKSATDHAGESWLGRAVNTVAGAVNPVYDSIAAVARLAGMLTSAEGWRRLGRGAAGVALVVVGLLVVLADSRTVSTLAGR